MREAYESRSTNHQGGGVPFHGAVKEELLGCPDCAYSQVVRMGKRRRQLLTVPIDLNLTTMVAEEQRCWCKDCGRLFAPPPFYPEACPDIRRLHRRHPR